MGTAIEDVSTTTAGFVGPSESGPLGHPEAVTSVAEFERGYGDGSQLEFSDRAEPTHNYLWHAARAFFAQGGRRLYRTIAGRVVVWGAHTVSSDPEWRYVAVRRYIAYLEHSIDRGTQWAVFEPNDEPLWVTVRRSVTGFLLAEFRLGALVRQRPEYAFFVKCDRSTMTQDDLDNGRLVCLVGVAVLRPAEFVIIRIGHSTAGAA